MEIAEREDIYTTLRNAMHIASRAVVGRAAKSVDWASEDLFRKFYLHYNSSYSIFNTTQNIRDGQSDVSCIDHSSVKVICRAAHETYLMHFWLRESCIENLDAQKFRHYVWKLTSLYLVQSADYRFIDATKALKSNKQSIELFMEKLKNTDKYKSLNGKEKQRCMKSIKAGRDIYGRPSWKQLISSSGVAKHFCQVYSYLCDYSHSGSLSTTQVRLADSLEDQRMLCSAALTLNFVFAAKFVSAYCNLYQDARSELNKHAHEKSVVEFYAQVMSQDNFDNYFR